MRLLFLSSEHAATKGTGGIGSYVATMTRTLAGRGHDVHVLTCIPGVPSSDSVLDGVCLHVRPTVRVRGLARVVRGPLTRSRLLLALSNYRYARRLGPFDVIEAPEWEAPGLLFARGRLVTHLHTPTRLLLEYNYEPFDRDASWADRLERAATRRSVAVTSTSQLLLDDLGRRGWLGPAARISMIRYPVEWSGYVEPANPEGAPALSRARHDVLVVGRLERRKAPELVVQALAELRTAGQPVSATFIGRSSGLREGLPYADWLRRLVENLGVSCTFVGEVRQDDLGQFYQASRLVCVPSVFESFSLAAAEAMAAARPVVMSPQVGAAELLAEDDNGQVCAPEPKAFATAISRFLADPAYSDRVGADNRRRLIESCDPERVATAREALYRTVAARSTDAVRETRSGPGRTR